MAMCDNFDSLVHRGGHRTAQTRAIAVTAERANDEMINTLEEFEQEYLPLRDKVRELREYL